MPDLQPGQPGSALDSEGLTVAKLAPGQQGYQQVAPPWQSPEAMASLTPKLAAWLQLGSAQEANREQQQRMLEGIGVLTPGQPATAAATPPNLHQLLGEPGYGGQYWKRRETAATQRANEEYQRDRQLLESQSRRGMNKAYLDQRMGELDDKRQARMARDMSGLEAERAQLEQQMKAQQAQQHVGLYGMAAGDERAREAQQAQLLSQWPSMEMPWTTIEQYLRQAGYDAQQIAMAGEMWRQRRAGGGGGGGGGGGAPQPWEDTSGFGDFGFGTRRKTRQAPHPPPPKPLIDPDIIENF